MSKESAHNLECEIGIDAEGHFKALAKQPMSFQDALSELIDNSISSSIDSVEYFVSKNPEKSIRIDISIIKDDQVVEVIVADSGKGIPRENMAKNILKTGDTNLADGILNEHGFGLKNSLCWLTNNEGEIPFKIISKTKKQDDEFVGLIEGPFRRGMKVKLDVFEDLWRKGVKSLTELNQGTRIHFRTTYKKLKTAYPKARNRMSTLMMALAEHLGVSYKKFLEHSDQNKINIFWEDGLGSRDEIQLEPIYPVYRQDTDVEGNKYHRKDDLIVLDDGNNYKVSYERGIVDWEKTRKKYKDSKVVSSGSSGSPFKIYYRKNQVSQGVNVVYLGRTLNTSLFSEIWSDKNRHNDFNDFYGEIVINHPEFETVNNKTEINHNGDLWQDLIGDLNSGEQFRPIRYGKKKKESDIKVKLKSVLESDAMTERVDKEKSTSADVNIDLLRVMDSGEELIYEVKRGRAKLLDVYQCIMYWDTYKKIESANPTKAILVGKSISDDAKNVLEEWNARKDVVGDPYKIIFQTLDELGVEE